MNAFYLYDEGVDMENNFGPIEKKVKDVILA